MIIDTHAHLNDKRYLDDLEDVLNRSLAEGIVATIIPGADPRELEYAVELCQKHKELFFAVGVHPYDIEFYDREFLQKYITHPKCVAVGECGLDYFRLPKDEKEKQENILEQKRVFIDQIKLANQYNKPLIVHIREASHDSLEILKEYCNKDKGGVLHCFNASPILLELVDYNFYYGIGGVVTFKNAKKLVEILPKIPIERILFETDAPYLTPEPHRGERNEPAYTNFVAKKVSGILDIDTKSLENIVYENSKRLFGDFSV
ncbi:MAG: hydrolase TatD [Sulfurospirillum sp.]|nr:MAG: hydrolase TatD [Sulfurospirillum sp.]